MAMPRASTTFHLILAAVVALSFSTGDACDNIPSMSIDEACDKACINVSSPQVQLCQSMLRAMGAPPTAEVTVYVVAAAKAAKKSYNSSMAIIDRLLANPVLPDGEKAAYELCKERYETALEYMIGVTNQMSLHAFAYPRQEYIDATVAITACGNSLADFQSSPLYDANAADLNNTFVAYDLGGLIVGK
jgi:NADH:ubiquinone reductase (non-electrogenic)